VVEAKDNDDDAVEAAEAVVEAEDAVELLVAAALTSRPSPQGIALNHTRQRSERYPHARVNKKKDTVHLPRAVSHEQAASFAQMPTRS
jgi:hypothetical protein